MPTLREFTPKLEKELHDIICKEIDALETGLTILKYEMGIGSGILDFLCVDSGGQLVIIEVKLEGDEGILFQALQYYLAVQRTKHQIASIHHDKKIQANDDPRIILIAKSFSDRIRQLTLVVKPRIDLYEYKTLETPQGDVGIVFYFQSPPKEEERISQPPNLDSHKDYVTNKELRLFLESLLSKIQNIGEAIQIYYTQPYIGFKVKGKQFAQIETRRSALHLYVKNLYEDGSWDWTLKVIKSETDDISEFMNEISNWYKRLTE